MTPQRPIAHSKLLRILTWIVLVISLLGIGLNSSGLVAAERDPTIRLAQLVATLPVLFYLAAIWSIQRAFGALAKGGAIERILARLLARVGGCLFLGGIVRVFVEPWLMRLVLQAPWPVGNFDVAAITLGTVGLLLMFVTVPLRDAAAMRSELDEIV